MSTVIAPSLTLERRYRAPPEKVFSAWTDPRKLARWFCPPQCEPVLAESSARVGGRYRIVVRTPGGEEHDVRGTFHEVVPDRKLVFNLGLANHAGAGIAGDARARARRRRHRADADARAVLRRGGTRPPPSRLEPGPRSPG